MNRRELYSGMQVAYRQTKHHPPRRAIIQRVDHREGHGAKHNIQFVDPDGTVLDPIYTATSYQLSDWKNEPEAVEEAQFEEKKREIAAALKAANIERMREPCERVVNLLELEGIEAQVAQNPYATREKSPFSIRILNASAFVALIEPILTKRATDRLFSPAPTDPEPPAEISETDVEQN